jgi:Concanavalin A-like lectin/glucanases superfamily
MKNILHFLCALCALTFCTNQIQAAPVAGGEPGFQLTIELRDGSRVVGKSLDDPLRFHSSSLGDMKLSMAGIRSIEFAANGGMARLTATNGDVFAVQFSAATLRVETGFGKTELPVKLLKSVRVSTAGRPGQLPEDLVALWSGEGNANDSVGGNNGQLVGSFGFAPGKVGQAFSLNEGGNVGDDFQDGRFSNGLRGFRPDRGGGYVQIPASPDLDVGLSDGLTIAAWINPTSLDLQEICEWNQNNGAATGAGQIGVHLEINEASGDGSLWGNVVDTFGVSHNLHSDNGVIIPNRFQQVAMTYDKTTGAAVLYRDGAVVATANLGVFTPQTSFDLFLGTRPSGFFTGIFYQGKMDEVGIFNRALSAAEIRVIYEAVPPNNPVLQTQKPLPTMVKTNVQTKVVATNETGFRLTIGLKDGSRVVGKSPDQTLRFHSSSLGDMKLSLTSIRSIEFAGNTEIARLTVTNGDVFAVQFSAANLRVETSFGQNDLPVKLIRSLNVAAMNKPGQLPLGLVALWSGEEGDGNDSVGGNNMMLTDISFAEGSVGHAFSFNGTSSSIKIPASPALDIGAGDGFTIMAWIKPSEVDGLHPIIQWSEGSNPLSLWIGIRPYENGVLRSDITDADGNRFVVSNPDVLASGIFQHIALTYDKASGIGTWYLNGIIVAQRQLSGLVHTKGDLLISRRNTRQGDWSSNRSFAGLMDEIAIYNRALSAAEVQAVFTEQSKGETLPLPAPSTGWFESWMR